MGTEESVLRLVFVGDIALGNHPKAPGFGFYSKYIKGIPVGFEQRALPPGTLPDVAFGNLEFPLTADANHMGSNACCMGSISFIPFLRQAGFTVVNVANNHCWEHGSQFFWETVRSLQSAGIKVVGIPDDFDPAGFLKVKGKGVAILGCSARPRQGFTTRPGYNEFDRVRFLGKIRDARRDADLVCVSIHWGEEFLPMPNPWEREIARSMIAEGAIVVVGHHPHVLREVENYRDGVIAYSLGNFIGDMIWNPLTRESGCLVVETEGSCIHSKAFIPAVIGRDYFPHYLDELERREFLNHQKARHARLSRELETSSYEFLARRALKRHQWLTLVFLLKSIYRYRFSVLREIIGHRLAVLVQRPNK